MRDTKNNIKVFFHKKAIENLKSTLLYLEDSEKTFVKSVIKKHNKCLNSLNTTFDVSDADNAEYGRSRSFLERKIYDYIKSFAKNDCHFMKIHWFLWNGYKVPHEIVSALISCYRSEHKTSQIGTIAKESIFYWLIEDFNNRFNINEILTTNKYEEHE